MSEHKTGHCLPLYLKNRVLLSALDDGEALPQVVSDEQQVLAQFRERACEQAVSILEELYVSLFGGATSILPYRCDRRTQRRTVREHWYMSGRLFRKHERIPRAGWDIFLASLRDKGPSVTIVLGPLEPDSTTEFDDLSAAVAPALGLESANARHCFTHSAGYDVGIVASHMALGHDTVFKDVVKGLRDRSTAFFGKFRSQFEAALDASSMRWAALLWCALAGHHAYANTCEGPVECCSQQLVHDKHPHEVALGIVVLGVANLSERSGTWDTDYYLYEEWTPSPGFTPQTEVVNEIAHLSSQFDTTLLLDGKCLRSRRVRSTLRTSYNLRTFPFDRQTLSLEISDDEFAAPELTYTARPYAVGFGDEVRTTLSSWKIDSDPVFAHEVRAFKWERGAPAYDNASVRFVVRRHVTFHLFKYFLPLLVIVALAFSVFWIDPDDLGAPATIGVTCLLAAIAFQFAEASTLPEVSYLTLADRVYIVCYVAIAAALLETLLSNHLARKGLKMRAVWLDRRCRAAFPMVLVFALVASVVRAFSELQ